MVYEALNADQRGGTTLSGKRSFTIDQAAAQLTRAGLSWSGSLGTAATVTYAYRETAPRVMAQGIGGFAEFTYQQITATETALKIWSEIANITFVRVFGSTGSDYSNNATILFADYTTGDPGASAFAYMPGNPAFSSLSGDVWVNSSQSENRYVTNQYDYGFLTLLHEIGHAIGLSHPSDYDEPDDDSPTYALSASYGEDSLEYSVMSYFDIEDTGGKILPTIDAPGGPLVDDIAAVQRLYGANLKTNSADTVYGYNGGLSAGPTKPDQYLQSGCNGGGYWGSIWDGGGNDTLDFSRTAADSAMPSSQKIDLRAGFFSDVLGGVGNLSIAQGVTIENAIGGPGDDVIVGNDVANGLYGGPGNDRITGGLGDDTLDGGAGSDIAVYSGHARQYAVGGTGTMIVVGPEGRDVLTATESIGFRDAVISYDPDGHAAQVMRLYEAALGRAPDPLGLDYWLHSIDAGTSLRTVATAFLNSAEFSGATGSLSNSDYVEYLYQHALGRVSDPAGKAGWVGALDSGTQSRTDVLLAFSESAEDRVLTAGVLASGLYETDAVYQQVAALYDTALGRIPDAGGIDGWVGAIKSGALTLQSVSQSFATAPEFTRKTSGLNSSQQFVTYLYQNSLHRAPDTPGLAYWTSQMDHGASRADLLLDFAQSAEHLQLISSHITNGVDMYFG